MQRLFVTEQPLTLGGTKNPHLPKQQLYSEQDLLARIARNDHEAFQSLFDLWWDKIYSTALIFSKSEDFARDVAQEMFLYLWKEREKMATIENPKTYLLVAARNLIFRKLSRLKLETAHQQYLSHIAATTPGDITDQSATLNDLKRAVEEGIRQLPPQQQRAFRLSREQGLSHEQIAAEMGVSKQTVKDYIVRAIAFLRKYLGEYGHLVILLLLKNKY